ncbi:MAG: C39 family peptidase [Streptosporangiales bacterium]
MARRLHTKLLLAATAAAATTALVLPGAAAAAPSQQSVPDRHVSYHQWKGTRGLQHGETDGTRVLGNRLRLGKHAEPFSYTDPFGDAGARTYDSGTWTSPVHQLGFGATEAVASWNARTPTGTWVQIQMRGRRANHPGWTKWYIMGRWASGDDYAHGDIHRTSVPSQGDDDGYIAIDTYKASDGTSIDAYQLKVTLLRPKGTNATPRLSKIGLMASRLPGTETVPTSKFTLGKRVALDVPEFSQDEHVGHYPQYDNGGEAWCSPTSTTMDVYSWNRRVPQAKLRWVEPKPHVDPQVDYAARYTFDYNYDGAGNWPFNAAYAAEFPHMESFVTRLRSLAEAEQFIKAGIPLVISVSFDAEDMDGAGYSTNGHLFVITGFTADGDVIINDPATAHDASVTRVYRRDQVENAWVPHSGGIAYVIHPANVPLPPNVSDEHNW